MTAVLIATRNAHKVQEIQQILGRNLHYLTLNNFTGVPPVLEDAETFAGNASKKVMAIASWLAQHSELTLATVAAMEDRFYLVADDSGLEVDALQGAPGVHSARFAALDVSGAANSPDAANNAKLLRLLAAVPSPKRTARFVCVLAVLRLAFSPITRHVFPFSERQVVFFEGACEGRIVAQAMGKGGFGYDPLFVPDGYSQSFAELGDAKKNKLSHRARALEKAKHLITK